MGEDLLSQFPLAERASSALGLIVCPMVEFDADDAMDTAAVRWRGESVVEQVVICSLDKDLTQVVQDYEVVTLDRIRGITLDENGVQSRFGVGPDSISDYLALVGDAPDSIPGVNR